MRRIKDRQISNYKIYTFSFKFDDWTMRNVDVKEGDIVTIKTIIGGIEETITGKVTGYSNKIFEGILQKEYINIDTSASYESSIRTVEMRSIYDICLGDQYIEPEPDPSKPDNVVPEPDDEYPIPDGNDIPNLSDPTVEESEKLTNLFIYTPLLEYISPEPGIVTYLCDEYMIIRLDSDKSYRKISLEKYTIKNEFVLELQRITNLSVGDRFKENAKIASVEDDSYLINHSDTNYVVCVNNSSIIVDKKHMISIENTNFTITNPNNPITLDIKTYPENAQTIIDVDNTEVVSVIENKVYGIANGNSILTISLVGEENIYTCCLIVVELEEYINFHTTKFAVNWSNLHPILEYDVYPPESNAVINVDDTSIATIENNIIYPWKSGSTQFTASLENSNIQSVGFIDVDLNSNVSDRVLELYSNDINVENNIIDCSTLPLTLKVYSNGVPSIVTDAIYDVVVTEYGVLITINEIPVNEEKQNTLIIYSGDSSLEYLLNVKEITNNE